MWLRARFWFWRRSLLVLLDNGGFLILIGSVLSRRMVGIREGSGSRLRSMVEFRDRILDLVSGQFCLGSG